MIVVVHGATGAQGRPVVEKLLAAGHTVRAVSRSAEPSRLPVGVHAVAADLLDVNALTTAYTGADAVIVVLPGGAAIEAAVAQADTILHALRTARVPRAVVNAGGAVWSQPPGIAFLDARTRLATGLPDAVPIATVIGPATALTDNFSETWIVERLHATGELVNTVPADTVMTPVAMTDIATVITGLLTDPQPPARVVVHGPNKSPGRRSPRPSPRTWTGPSPGPARHLDHHHSPAVPGRSRRRTRRAVRRQHRPALRTRRPRHHQQHPFGGYSPQ